MQACSLEKVYLRMYVVMTKSFSCREFEGIKKGDRCRSPIMLMCVVLHTHMGDKKEGEEVCMLCSGEAFR